MMNQGQRLRAWHAFIEKGELQASVNHFVANSWNRCRGRQNPEIESSLKQLSAEHLLASQVAGFELLSISRPVMEDIFQFVEGSHIAIVLVNSAGYILDMLGDVDMLEYIDGFGIARGALLSEAMMGTNAFGLALLEGFPVRVVGAEHYQKRFHDLADEAAPIFDPSGRLLGVLGLVTPLSVQHPHSLGMAVAGARAVEGQWQSDQLLAEQNSQLAQLNAILRANSEAILVWNADGILIHINPAAVKILGLPKQVVHGRRIGDYVKYPDWLGEAVEKREPLNDVEVNLEVDERSISAILSLRYVEQGGRLQWVVCTARRDTDVRRLVRSQLGANAALRLEDIPGESAPMRRVRRFIRAAAPAQASILIRGETGTGKNPVASAIHNESARRDEPFMIFACSSIPSELVVNELLGFDEALSSKIPGGRPSKFELAHGGTLYFQDVDALPLEAQGILLNLIDLGIVQRLGSDRPIPVDVRIIASSSVDMEKLIAQGNFRSDLFYRLCAFEINIPPLRQRLEDLPFLVDRIMGRLSVQINRQLVLDTEVIEALRGYSWPGNIRELEAGLGRAAMQAGFSGVIRAVHLPDYIQHPVSRFNGSHTVTDVQPLSDMEREAILRAAELCHGNVSEMARVLGIGRTTVWRRLRTFNLSLDDYRAN